MLCMARSWDMDTEVLGSEGALSIMRMMRLELGRAGKGIQGLGGGGEGVADAGD
jgi:hypothetical protein